MMGRQGRGNVVSYRHQIARLPVALCALLVAASPALSGDLGPGPMSGNKWEFSLTPYAWAINVHGEVTARGHSADVNEDFFQIVEKSDSLLAWMSFFEARKGRFSVFTDFVWMDLTFPGHFQRTLTGPFGRATLNIKGNAELDYQQIIVQSGVAYEIARWQRSSGSHTALDIMGSARYWNEETDLSLRLTGTLTVDLERLGLQLKRSRKVALARSGDLE